MMTGEALHVNHSTTITEQFAGAIPTRRCKIQMVLHECVVCVRALALAASESVVGLPVFASVIMCVYVFTYLSL